MHVCRSVLGFSCAHSGLLLPFPSVFFCCMFLWGLKDPYVYSLCPPVSIETISIPSFAVSCFDIVRVHHGRILDHNEHLFPTQALFSLPTTTLCPNVQNPTHRCLPWARHCHPQRITLYVIRTYECCVSFLHILACAVNCVCTHVLCVCLHVLGCFPFTHVPTLTLRTYAYVVVPVLAFVDIVR